MLIDTLIAQFTQMGDKEAKFATAMMQAIRFQVDNVARYQYESKPPDLRDKRSPYRLEEHIPNIAPLANVMCLNIAVHRLGYLHLIRWGAWLLSDTNVILARA